MQEWAQFFTITYHPADEAYVVHWSDSYVPVDQRGWRVRENACRWLEENWQRLISDKLEEAVWE